MKILEMEKAHSLQLHEQEEKAGESYCEMEDALNGTIEELEGKIKDLNMNIQDITTSKQEVELKLNAQIEKLIEEKDSIVANFAEKEQAHTLQLKDMESVQEEKERVSAERIESLSVKIAELESDNEKLKTSHEDELRNVHVQIEEKSMEAQGQLGKLVLIVFNMLTSYSPILRIQCNI